jgi:hypothetical protein
MICQQLIQKTFQITVVRDYRRDGGGGVAGASFPGVVVNFMEKLAADYCGGGRGVELCPVSFVKFL